MENSDTKGALTIRTQAMPADANPSGDIFGGWVLSQMDIAGGVAAAERAQGRVATVGIEAMTFLRPVKVGDILCVYTSIKKVGRTSIAVEVQAWTKKVRRAEVSREQVTHGVFTFVALDDDGKPHPVDQSD